MSLYILVHFPDSSNLYSCDIITLVACEIIFDQSIIKVTVKENSFQLKPSKRLVAMMLNPERKFLGNIQLQPLKVIK